MGQYRVRQACGRWKLWNTAGMLPADNTASDHALAPFKRAAAILWDCVSLQLLSDAGMMFNSFCMRKGC